MALSIWLATLAIMIGIGTLYIWNNPQMLYRESEEGHLVRQCRLPLYYVIENDIPDKYKEMIVSGFDYWNKVARTHGKKRGDIFMPIRVEDSIDEIDLSDIVAVMTLNVKFDGMLAATMYTDEPDGCTSQADIFILDYTLETQEDDVVEAVIKHEIGHVLGFGHSTIPWHLMYYSVSDVEELSDWEIEAFKVSY